MKVNFCVVRIICPSVEDAACGIHSGASVAFRTGRDIVSEKQDNKRNYDVLALVTGGTGLVGRALIERLLAEGVRVRHFGRRPHPDERVGFAEGDLRDAEAVRKAVEGVDTVFHVAAAISQRLDRPAFVYDVNVTGTENVLAAAQAHGVGRLVYTSSTDVMYGGHPMRNADETTPIPEQHLNYYGETKAIAERLILEANGRDGLATCALRLAGVYGPHDRSYFPAVLAPAVREGRFIGMNAPDTLRTQVFVENVAHAHWLAAQHLTLDAPIAGEAYIITDHAPMEFFAFFLPYLDALELAYSVQRIPVWLGRLMANFYDWRWRLLPTEANADVLLSPYTIATTTQDFSFSHAKATRDFGYEPIVSEEEAFQKTLAWLRDEWLPSVKG